MRKKTMPAGEYIFGRTRAAAAFTFVINLLILALNLVKARGISRVIMIAESGNVKKVVILSAVIIIVCLVGYTVKTVLSDKRENRLALSRHEIRKKTQENILEKSLTDINGAGVGETLENLTDDLNGAVSYYADMIPGIICAAVQTLFYSIYIGVLSPMMLAILAALALLQIVPPIIVERYMEKYYGETRDIEAEVTEEMISGYNGLAEIKRSNAIDKVTERFTRLHERVFLVDRKNQRLLQTENAMDNFVGNALTYGTYAILGAFAAFGMIEIDKALQMIIISGAFYGAVKQIFEQLPQMRVSKLALSRVNVWFEKETDAYGSKSAGGYIGFRDVSYAYPDSEDNIFSHLTLSIPEDRLSIVVGENGSGKSTLIKLLVGAVRPDSGEVSVFGCDPCRWSDEERARHIFFLSQSDPEFHITARELFGEFEEKSAGRCFENAGIFGLGEQALDTCIADLSGGERKKVFLCAALAADESVFLLLDEPTNSLDAEGVDILLSLLAKRRGGGLAVSHDQRIMRLDCPRFTVSEKGVLKGDEEA